MKSGKMSATSKLSLRHRTTIALCRLAGQLARRLGRQASSLPGLIASHLDPSLLAALTAGQEVVLVSGTNGKSTTVSILVQMLEASGRLVIANSSGANMIEGILTSTMERAELLRTPQETEKRPILVYEVDEAWLPRLTPTLQPHCFVFTNLFRDQVDRYGTPDQTRKLLQKAVETAPGAIRVLNADEPMVASLGEIPGSGQVLYCGMAEPLMHEASEAELRDLLPVPCPRCGHSLQFSRFIYPPTGTYHCPACGFEHPHSQMIVAPQADGKLSFRAELPGQPVQEGESSLGIPGAHNQINACTALTAALALGVDFSLAMQVLPQLSAVSGRMEEVQLPSGRGFTQILIKNPVGLEAAFRYLAEQKGERAVHCLLLAVNQRENDGRDASWLKEVHYDSLLAQKEEPLHIVVSGEASQLLYDILLEWGFPAAQVERISAVGEAASRFMELLPAGGWGYVLPNYTASLTIRKDLHD